MSLLQHPPPDRDEPCTMYAQYGFCPYGWDCQCKHGPLPEKDLNEIFNELIYMGNQHTQGIYKCVVCGNTQDPNNRVTAKVGETEAYPFCGTCGSFYYYPHMQVVILKLILQCKQDYMEFKRQVDGRYRRLPAILHAPFMYEAHRWATSRYAWSLTGPDNAREMLEAAFKYKKQCSKIVSMGAGTGYIEHVFFHAAKELSHEVKVYAYDAMPQKKIGVKFDIEVEMGDVDSLAAFGDMSEDILLLCWPPFGSKVREESQMAYDTILKFAQQGGDFLIYVGDVNATGDWRFHDHLASHWELLEETHAMKKLEVWVPQKMGLLYAGNDSAGVYRKREVPLQIEPPQWTVTA